MNDASHAAMLKAWRQLAHVLTHEIMNSLTPIASLADTAQELASGDDADLAEALETIARRTESLANCVAEYPRVVDWPEPVLPPVALDALFARVEGLVATDWQARGGGARFDVAPATLTLVTDDGQLEQALLNLLSNAAHATAGASRSRCATTAPACPAAWSRTPSCRSSAPANMARASAWPWYAASCTAWAAACAT